MYNFAVKTQQLGATKNSQGFKSTALADLLMASVQDIPRFLDLKIKISKPHKVALLYSKYS